MTTIKRPWRLLLLSFALLSISVATPAHAQESGNDDDNADVGAAMAMPLLADGDVAVPPLPTADTNHDVNSNINSGNINNDANPTLDADSVVLITGAAGFLGSELALALRRTYNVKKLLLVDNLGIDSENEAAYVPPTSETGEDEAIYEKLSEETLSLFEIRRQRMFRVFHELTAPQMDGHDPTNPPTTANQNTQESIRFYRADLRPSIPEFFDFGEVPLLYGIFQSHPDITHVVHLADVPQTNQWGKQAVPREKDSVKAGRMEGVLEELRLLVEKNANGGGEGGKLPQFVYASSHEVYDNISTAVVSSNNKQQQQPNPPPFQEHLPITTPSSLRGTSKLIDEVLASAYHSTHGIYSVGLRLFEVYGPWNTPGTEVFDLVEEITGENDSVGLDGTVTKEDGDAPPVFDKDVKDYVYIDDAVDAIMSAMQYRPLGSDPPPVVFNVGTGKGTTLKELKEEMVGHFPKLSNGPGSQTSRIAKERLATTSYASTARSEALLGFQPQVSLKEGLAHTITWHRDRTYPYGRDPRTQESLEHKSVDSVIARNLEMARGGDAAKCSPLDRECLRGAPVFPCASECRRVERCTPSAWDDVANLSRLVTTGCDAVLYTILLDESTDQIPSAAATVSGFMPFVGAGLPEDLGKRTQARCNIAFVSESSPLVQRLKSEGEEYLDEDNESGLPPLLRHGFWTVLPVKTPGSNSGAWIHAFAGSFALEYLPKVSPGRFFGSSVRYAAYVEPSIIIDNLPKLLKKMEDGPPTKDGRTAVMLSEKRQSCDPTARGSTCTWTRPAQNDSIQSSVYNMIRVALRGELLGGGLHPVVDSSFIIHSLSEEDARLFRCDAYGEAAQWGASGDERALEFIISLHDLWSKAVLHWSGHTPWWTVAENQTNGGVPNGGDGDDESGNKDDVEAKQKRRLSEEDGRGKGTWMGILSTDVQLFTHILPSEMMGIIHLDNYQGQQKS